MTKKLVCALTFAFFVATLFSAAPRAWAQEAEQKDTAEKTRLESPAKRAAPGPRVTKTFFLSNLSQPTELQDLVNTLRVIAEIARISMIPSENAIVAEGTPDQMALAEKIIDELDRGKKKFGGNYRVDLKISEIEGGKKLNSRTYSLLIEPHLTGKLRVGARIPVPINAEASKQVQYVDVGQNIDCTVRSESEREVVLNVDLDFSNFVMSDLPQADTALRQFRVTDQVALELGKPSIVSSFDDPGSKRTIQIEVTAVRVKPKL